MTRSVGSGDKDEFMGISARSHRLETTLFPTATPQKPWTVAVTRRENGQPFYLGIPKEACRSQPASKEPQQTCDVCLRSLPGHPKESGWTD